MEYVCQSCGSTFSGALPSTCVCGSTSWSAKDDEQSFLGVVQPDERRIATYAPSPNGPEGENR